jgi:oxygen-dependent protoporphyrinogen oxidase
MQTLPNAIAACLGEKVIFFSEVKSIAKTAKGFLINYDNAGQKGSIECNSVISTVPAFIAAEIFKDWDERLANHLKEVYYPPVLVLYVAYKKEDIKQPLDGFGFLIPAKERKSFLGAIWSSIIFPNRTDENKATFTLFVGGARDPEIGNVDKDILINKVRKEFEQLMKISGEPVFQTYKYWSKAIPQYNIGYIEHEKYFDEFERNNPGITLSGNYRGGISVGDCIKSAGEVIKRFKD